MAISAWGSFDDSCDWAMTYSGTWGIGLQLKDLSFVDDLSHTFRVAYWGRNKQPVNGQSTWKAPTRGAKAMEATAHI